MVLALNEMVDKRVAQIDATGSLLNQILATPLRVVGNDMQIISFGVYWKFNIVLNASM